MAILPRASNGRDNEQSKSFKDMIKEVLHYQDVFMTIITRGKDLHIRPVTAFTQEFYEEHPENLLEEELNTVYALESLNILEDSVTVTEANSNAVNKVTVKNKDKKLSFSYLDHIKHFGTNEKVITTEDEGHTIHEAYYRINKSRRDNKHKIELKIIGDYHFKVGRWCVVNCSSFDTETMMFISNLNHSLSSSDEWITTLELVDYPPELT